MVQRWPTKKLGEIYENIKKEKASIGEVPYIEIGNIDVNNKKIILTYKEAVNGSIFAPENSILISRVRPTRGAVAFVDKKIAVSSAFTIIKPKADYNPKLLFYFLAWNKKFFDYLGERQKGTNYPSVREEDILEFEVALPENKEEQQKIVKILDTIQSAIEIQEKIIEKTKELKKSLMNLLFHYGLAGLRVKELASSRVGELSSSEIEKLGLRLKKTKIGEIPEDWEVVKLGKVLKLSSGKSRPSQISNDQTEKMLYPVYGGNGIIGYSDKFIITHPTIVIGRVGEYCGAVYKAQNFAWITDNALYATDIELQKIDLDFSVHYFNYLNLNKFKKKSGQPLLTQTIIYSISIPLPPLPEQKEIAEILQTIDQKIEIEKKKKELYEELFKTLLNKIMNQEIDVNLLNY
jgi:type I restriction enzyme S subunit